jgi:hypothetical protein
MPWRLSFVVAILAYALAVIVIVFLGCKPGETFLARAICRPGARPYRARMGDRIVPDWAAILSYFC